MPKLLRKPAANSPAKDPKTHQFQPDPRREQIFDMYRDLGPGRTYRQLVEAVSVRWPANPISIGTISLWAKKDGWPKRIEQYERGIGVAATGQKIEVAAGDDVQNLRKAASQALARVLQSSSVAVTKPGDMKALVDTASKALELAKEIEQERTGTATSEEIAAFGKKLLDRIVEARRRDIVEIVKAAAEAACAAAGTTDLIGVLTKTAAAAGLRVTEEGKFEEEATIKVDEAADEAAAIKINKAVDEAAIEVGKSNEAIDEAAIDLGNDAVDEQENDLEEMMRKLRGE